MSTTATFTDLLRHPKEVVAHASDGAVRITRRDAEDLIIMRAGDLERHDAGIAVASRLMRAVFRRGGNIADAVADVFGWVDLLDTAERARFTAEIEALIFSAAELGEYARLLQTVQSWEGTAEAYAAGLTPADPGDWIVDLPAVERP